MNIELTRKQFWIVSTLLGLLLFFVSMCVNMIGLYYSDEVSIRCINGSVETYNKTDLNLLDKVCGGTNTYKYNDNSGLGAYFPIKVNNGVFDELNNK